MTVYLRLRKRQWKVYRFAADLFSNALPEDYCTRYDILITQLAELKTAAIIIEPSRCFSWYFTSAYRNRESPPSAGYFPQNSCIAKGAWQVGDDVYTRFEQVNTQAYLHALGLYCLDFDA